MDYSIPYPYSWTILSLLLFSAVGLYISKDKVNWERYLKGLIFCTLAGVIQIVLMQNVGNVPAWYYPDGSAIGRDWITFLLPDVCFEDVLFVPACYSVFYYFSFRTRNVPDICRKWIVPIGGLFIAAESIVYYIGGPMAKDMIVCFTIFPIMVFVLVKPNGLKNVNITHSLLCIVFIILFAAPWEIVNTIRHYWVYDTRCDLYGDKGWFFNDYLHVSIFFQYAWSGAEVFLFSINYFGRDVSRETI